MGTVYIITVPLQCRLVCLYVKTEYHITTYFQKFLLRMLKVRITAYDLYMHPLITNNYRLYGNAYKG